MSTKPKNQELDLKAELVANAFATGRSFDDLINEHSALEAQKLLYIARSAVYKILRCAENLGDLKAALSKLEDSEFVEPQSLKLHALTILIENENVEAAQQLHAELNITVQSLTRKNRSKYAEFALTTNNEALFMSIFEYEMNSVDPNDPSTINELVGLIYSYARTRDANATSALWALVKKTLPTELTEIPYYNFIKKMRSDATLSLNPDTQEIALAHEKRTFLTIRSALIETNDWPELYKLLKEYIPILLNADEGNNMGLLGQDIQALFDANQHDRAFQLWIQILDLKPVCAKAAFTFARKNKSSSRYKTKLLSRSDHRVTRGKLKTAVGHLPKAVQDSEVVLGNKSKRVTDWFKAAATLASQANYNGAVAILLDLVHEIPSSTSIVIVKISNMLLHLDVAAALSILDISTNVRKRPQLVKVFNSVAARQLLREREQLADAIYAQLTTIVVSPELSYSKATALIKVGKNQEAVEIMIASIEKYPQVVFQFVLYLLNQHLFEYCLTLYKALQSRSKDFALSFVYAVLRQQNDEEFRANVFELVLPETKGLPVSSDETTVVSLVFDFLDWDPSKKLGYIEELERNRELPYDIAMKLQSKAHTAFIRQQITARDKAIEEFVEAQMPTLKTGKFFETITGNLQITNPGKRTSKMARSVLTKPERMAPNNTMPGKKDRKN